MITAVKERRVQVMVEGGGEHGIWFSATVRDGEISGFTHAPGNPSKECIEVYITFLREVIEAIDQTKVT